MDIAHILGFVGPYLLKVIPIVGAILWSAFSLGKRLGNLETSSLKVLQSIHASMVSQDLLLGALTDKKILSEKQVRAVTKPFTDYSIQGIEQMIATLKPKGNPITSDELTTLRELVSEVTHNKRMALHGAVTLLGLARKLREEYPDESAWNDLEQIAAFYVGLADGKDSDEDAPPEE
jgi:hypothetical protein